MALSRYGNWVGRQHGSVNRTTREAREFASRVISDPEYCANLLERARTGQLGAFEATLWAYAAGKPPDHLMVRVAPALAEDALAKFSNEDLADRASALAHACRLLSELRLAQDVIDVSPSATAAQPEPIALPVQAGAEGPEEQGSQSESADKRDARDCPYGTPRAVYVREKREREALVELLLAEQDAAHSAAQEEEK